MRRLLALAALLAASCSAPLTPVYAQRVPPVDRIGISHSAETFLDSLARTSRTKDVETAGCVVRYAITRDTLLLAMLTGAHYERADSLDIYANAPICPLGVPVVHTHLTRHADPMPTPVDSASARAGGMWSLVLVVSDSSWHLIIYGGVPSPR